MSALIDTYAEPPASLLAGYDGCCRYISHESSKSIDAGQVQRIHAQGKSIVLNFEDNATNAQGGRGQGTTDGQFAAGVARSISAPPGVAIYASVDYEVHSGPPLAVAQDYFRGWTPTVRTAGYLSGAYGDADLITALLNAGLIDLGWQTAAWSYGSRVRDPRAALLQDQFTPGYDVNEVTAGFYGGWLPSGAQPHPGSPGQAPNLSQEDDEMYTLYQVVPNTPCAGRIYAVRAGSLPIWLSMTWLNRLKRFGLLTNPSKPDGILQQEIDDLTSCIKQGMVR